jgi:hypothetical protein
MGPRNEKIGGQETKRKNLRNETNRKKITFSNPDFKCFKKNNRKFEKNSTNPKIPQHFSKFS